MAHSTGIWNAKWVSGIVIVQAEHAFGLQSEFARANAMHFRGGETISKPRLKKG